MGGFGRGTSATPTKASASANATAPPSALRASSSTTVTSRAGAPGSASGTRTVAASVTSPQPQPQPHAPETLLESSRPERRATLASSLASVPLNLGWSLGLSLGIARRASAASGSPTSPPPRSSASSASTSASGSGSSTLAPALRDALELDLLARALTPAPPAIPSAAIDSPPSPRPRSRFAPSPEDFWVDSDRRDRARAMTQRVGWALHALLRDELSTSTTKRRIASGRAFEERGYLAPSSIAAAPLEWLDATLSAVTLSLSRSGSRSRSPSRASASSSSGAEPAESVSIARARDHGRGRGWSADEGVALAKARTSKRGRVPTLVSVSSFVERVQHRGDVEAPFLVAALVLLNRARARARSRDERVASSSFALTEHNWRLAFLVALLVAQKVADDDPLDARSVPVLLEAGVGGGAGAGAGAGGHARFTGLTPKRVARLEREFLASVAYDAAVTGGMYADAVRLLGVGPVSVSGQDPATPQPLARV